MVEPAAWRVRPEGASVTATRRRTGARRLTEWTMDNYRITTGTCSGGLIILVPAINLTKLFDFLKA